MRNKLGLVLLAAAVVIPACAESAPSDAQYDDLARIVGGETAERAAAFADSVMIAHGELPAGFSRQDTGLITGRRDGTLFHYYVATVPPRATVLAWWGDAMRTQAVWELTGAETPMATAAGHVSLMAGNANPYRLTGDADLLVFVDTPSGLVLGGAIHDVLEVTTDTGHTFDVLADVTFPSAGRATILLDGDRSYELDLTPAPDVQR